MKFITLVLLVVFICNSAFAADGIFLEESQAQKLEGDLKYYKSKIDELTSRQTLLDSSIVESDKEIGLLKQKSDLLTIDLDKSLKAKDEYKDLYKKADDERLKVLENQPSRMTWFGIGAISTAVFGLLLMILK